MWGLRLGVWKFHVRAPPDYTEKKQKIFFWLENSPDADFDGEKQQPWGFLPLFFSFLFPFFQASHTRKRIFFILCHPRVAKAIHTSLLWVFKGAQSSPTYLPTYHHPFKPQQKSGIESRLPPGYIFFCLFFLLFFLVKGSFLILFLIEGGGRRTGVPRISFLFLCVAYHTITYLGEHNFYLLCVWIISCWIGGRLERTSPDRG